MEARDQRSLFKDQGHRESNNVVTITLHQDDNARSQLGYAFSAACPLDYQMTELSMRRHSIAQVSGPGF